MREDCASSVIGVFPAGWRCDARRGAHHHRDGCDRGGGGPRSALCEHDPAPRRSPEPPPASCCPQFGGWGRFGSAGTSTGSRSLGQEASNARRAGALRRRGGRGHAGAGSGSRSLLLRDLGRSGARPLPGAESTSASRERRRVVDVPPLTDREAPTLALPVESRGSPATRRFRPPTRRGRPDDRRAREAPGRTRPPGGQARIDTRRRSGRAPRRRARPRGMDG
jgi:hypothetical protein